LNQKNEPCWIAVAGPSGLDKRQATVHPCIRGDGEQVVDIFIIFRGKGQISAEEAAALNAIPNVKWCFQKKAWANGKYSRAWLRYFCKTVQAHCPGEHLLFLDDLGAQKLASFNKICFENNVLPVGIPAGCTDLCQPVDHGVGAELKRLMNSFYKIELELNFAEWRQYKDTKSLSPSKRRILMATWLSHAWGILRTRRDFLRSCFTSTCLVRRDGSHSLKMKGVNDYPPKI